MKIYTVSGETTYFRETSTKMRLIEVEARETECYFIVSREDAYLFGHSTRVPKADHYRSKEAALAHRYCLEMDNVAIQEERLAGARLRLTNVRCLAEVAGVMTNTLGMGGKQ